MLPIWCSVVLVMFGFGLSHLFHRLKMWTLELFRNLFPSYGCTADDVPFPEGVVLRSWSCGAMVWTLPLWVVALRGIVTVIPLVQFLVSFVVCWIERTQCLATSVHVCCKEGTYSKKKKSSIYANECTVEMSIWNWFILASHNCNCCPLVFFP